VGEERKESWEKSRRPDSRETKGGGREGNMAMGFCRLLLEHGGLLMATMKHKSVYNAAVWL